MNVGEPARCAVVVIGEPFVVEAEQVEDRGVEVVDVDHVLDGLVAELVGGPEAEPMLDAGAGEPGGEALGVVVAAGGSLLKRGHAAELGGPDDSVSSSSPRALRSARSAAAGWSRIGP